MSRDSEADAGVIVFATPVSVGHVRPLMPLARRFVARGIPVVWAISGDDNEPASAWAQPLAEMGVQFVNIDEAARFARGTNAEFASMSMTSVFRRVLGRANDVSAGAAEAIRAAVGARKVRCGIYDYFALWAYVAMRSLGIADIDVVISAFPAIVDGFGSHMYEDDSVYVRELAQLRATGLGEFATVPRIGILPQDPALRTLSFSSPRLCPGVTGVQLLGVQRDALPRLEDMATAPEAHRALARRLEAERERGARVVMLSMGTVVTRFFARMGGPHLAFLKRLYSTLAESALRSGAIVLASTCESSAADLGLDEATLGPAARDRVIAMPYLPQPFLFAHGLVDVMLMHGGANTFHEAVVSGIPLLISPAVGDQEYVALAAARLGVGICVESLTVPTLPGAVSIERVAAELMPELLAPGISRWKAAAMQLAGQVKEEDGLDAAEAMVLGRR
jgi:UDP:flavonoid glycosyltransferase YjiC (YdhE family)